MPPSRPTRRDCLLGAALGPLAALAPCDARALAATTEARTGWFDTPDFATSAFGPTHPEQPARIAAIRARLAADAKLRAALRPLAPAGAGTTAAALARVHTPEHLAGIVRRHGEAVDALSRSATACAVAAVEAVWRGGIVHAFVASRPPGHHARNTGREEGFCFHNHVAVAARHAQALGAARVLIVDWDYHHGDGTEQLFYEDGSVFYFSTFHADAYPRTGDAARRGRGAGTGTTQNHPLAEGATDADVLAVYEQHLLPAAHVFRPDFVLVSAGFDSRADDRLGRFRFSDDGFRRMTALVAGIAARHAGGRLVSVLEGGYRLDGLASAAQAHLATLAEIAATRR